MINIFYLPDKENNFQGYMVYTLTLIWSIVTGFTVSMGFIFLPHSWLRWLSLLAGSIFLGVFNLTLNRLGHVRFASWSLSIMMWLYFTIPSYSAGGIEAPGIISQMSVILTAGFLLGWRGGLAFGALTMVTDFIFAYMQLTGNLPEPSVMHTPLTRWVSAIIPFGTTIALQYYATSHLRTGLTAMQREILNREKAEQITEQTVYDLKERVKELRTLYAVTCILQVEEARPENICFHIAEVLPAGWQYPDITAARVSIGKKAYNTSNYKSSACRQRAEMKTAKGTVVSIEVLYLEPMPVLDEGPFLQEERNLINMLVEMLKINMEGRERTTELKDYKYALDISSLVSISGEDGTFTYANENFCRASKYSSEELLGHDHNILWSGFHPAQYFDELEHALQDGKPYRGEFLNKAKDDSLYWVDSTIVPFLDAHGHVYQYLSINHDITTRKNAEHELKESEEKFRSLVEQNLVGVFILQEDKFKYINPGFEKMVGYTNEELLNDVSFGELVHEEDKIKIQKEYSLPTDENSPGQRIFKAIRKDGEIIYIEAIISAIIYNNKPATLGTLVNVTDRMEEEKRMCKAIIDAQEHERLQIGMEVHDNAVQLLTASSLTLDLVIRKIEPKEAIAELINDARGYIKEAGDELRRLSHQLAPSVDSSISLGEKINSLVKNMNSDNSLIVQTHIDDLGPSAKKDIPLAFYRILQEQFNNIIKHAEATKVKITITTDGGQHTLSIKDNGKGFAINEHKSGIGLQNIKRRTQMLGGETQIISSPGNGCVVLVKIPAA